MRGVRIARVVRAPGRVVADWFGERCDARLVRGDVAIDDRVVKALLASGELLLVSREGGREQPAAARVASASLQQ